MTEPRDETALKALFEAARDDAPSPDVSFMARLAEDAAANVPVREIAPRRTTLPHRRWFDGWAAGLALASTAAAGVWIGIALPETFEVPGTDFIGIDAQLSSLMPGYGADMLGEE